MEFERPWLIQRCYLNDKDGLNFDYMGSSEFEFGTIPKALTRLAGQKLVVRRFREVLFEIEFEFFTYGSSERDWQAYSPILLGLLDGSLRTLESTRLNEELEFLHNVREPRQYQSRTNIWFDLKNDCFFAISEEKINQLDRLWAAASNGEGEWSNQPFGGYILKRAAV
jgi:hypothetical protein